MDWFSQVDLSYRTELRELNDLNDLNFARFDAKVSLLRWMFGFWIGTALVILGSRLAQ